MARTQVPGQQVLDLTIDTGDIKDNAVTTPKIANGVVTASKLGTGALIGTDIQPYNAALAGIFRSVTISQSTVLTSLNAGLINVDASLGAVVLTLPPVGTSVGLTFKFKKIDTSTNGITISANTVAEKIDKLTTFLLLVPDAWVEVQSDGIMWRVISNGPITFPPALSLANGFPAWNDASSGLLVSTTSVDIPFLLATNGARNVYLNLYGAIISSGSRGFDLPRNCIIKTIYVQSRTPVVAAADFVIRANGSLTNLFTLTIPTGQDGAKIENVNLQLNASDRLQVYLSSSQNVVDPFIMCEIFWRN